MKERRIRLSANTAIQLYDVQDRLGYDRATKAIDWLMKEAKVAIDALDAGHQDDHQEYPVPATTAIFSPSVTFHQKPYDENQENSNRDQTSSFSNHAFGLMNSINRCPQEMNFFLASEAPLDVTWNPNYHRGEGYAFVNREPIQSTLPRPVAHASNNAFVNDNELLESCFQQETQVQEEEKNNIVVVPGRNLPSATSVMQYQD
ncbi:hypothetical protein L1887_17410 [Cichorium endivia]|nr:hypothetical protein L1887_17410 [Cichorium endivia]